MHASDIAASGPAAFSRPRLEATSKRHGERVIYYLLAACAGLSVLTTTAIVVSLLFPAIDIFGDVSPGTFFFGTDWGPTFEPPTFGVLPIVVGLSLVLIRLLKLDIDRSKQERQIRRLTQKLAILEQELDRLGGRRPPEPTDDNGR